jgi:hypothetical protein
VVKIAAKALPDEGSLRVAGGATGGATGLPHCNAALEEKRLPLPEIRAAREVLYVERRGADEAEALHDNPP